MARSRLTARSRRPRLYGTRCGTDSGTHSGTHRGTRPALSIGTSGANSSMRLGGTGPTSSRQTQWQIRPHLSSFRQQNCERTRQRTLYNSSHGSREADRKIAHFRIPIPGQSGIGNRITRFPVFGGFPDSRFPILDCRLAGIWIGKRAVARSAGTGNRGPGGGVPGVSWSGGTREFSPPTRLC